MNHSDITAVSTKKTAHSVVSNGRNGVYVTGVDDVLSFDEKTVLLHTDCGNMLIEGDELHISTLQIDSGILEAEGQINGIIYYEESRKKKGKWGKLFS